MAGGTRNAAPPRQRLLGTCRSRAAERNVGFRDRRKGSARERGPLAGRLPVAHVPCGLRLDGRSSSAPRAARRICSAAIRPSSNPGLLNRLVGAIATNSTTVIPFTSADRRRTVPSTEIPSHCGHGHPLTRGNVQIAARESRWRCRQCGRERAAAFPDGDRPRCGLFSAMMPRLRAHLLPAADRGRGNCAMSPPLHPLAPQGVMLRSRRSAKADSSCGVG